MKTLHDGMHTFEQAVIQNKWFSLACVTLLMASSVGVGAVLNKSTNGTACYVDAERTLFGPKKNRIYAHEVSPDIVMQARTHYSVCLLANGIDVRSVPEFEELFPFTAELDKDAYSPMNTFETTE
jgi:hypothetical protein